MRRLFLLPLLLLVAACDSASEDPEGTFTAEISGELAQSLEGDANFETVDLFREPALFIRMIQGSFAVKGVTLVDASGEITGPGTYALATDQEDGVGFLFTDLSQEEFIRGGLGGTLTISSLSEDRIAGTFAATIEASGDPGSTTSEIEGQFDAVFRSTAPPDRTLTPEAEARLATR